MTLLPIADRELRVSARSKATHRLRITFAMGAVAIAGAIGLISLANHGLFARQLGVIIFDVLKWITFAFACAAGIFLTADCLSEEKREGTLGLLFLTDLRGYDVVLGKLFATSLRSFYSLLAIFPVMGFSFILGGVAPDDFRHTLVSLCNTLFFSLALGMLISVISRDPHKAMTGTLAALAVFLFLIPALDSLLPGRYTGRPWVSLLSPTYAFNHAGSYRAADFWRSTLLVNFEGWCFLALASWLAPKTWHDRAVVPGLVTALRLPLFGSAAARSRGHRLLDQAPIAWIISRDRCASTLSRLAVILILGVFVLSLVSYPYHTAPTAAAPAMTATTTSSTITNSTGGTSTTSYSYSYAVGASKTTLFQFAEWCASALSLVLELWIATHVSRFYLDGKRNGFFELLLVTPVRPLDIIRGHWLALRQLFLAPVALLFIFSLAAGTIQFLAASNLSPPGALAALMPGAWSLAVGLLLGQMDWLTGLFALAWFSIWMGLTSQKITVAVLKTICFVKILPWFGAFFAMGLSMVFIMALFKTSGFWIIEMLPQALIIVVNIALIYLARHNVRNSFSSERSVL